MSDGMMLLGIDGGASKTRGAIVTAAGDLLARAEAGGSAIIGPPRAEACAVLASVVDSLCAQVGVSRADIAMTGVGLNGIDFEDEFATQHSGIADAIGIPPDRVLLVNDGIVALWGASSSPAATLLHHGSGITSAYRAGHGRERLFDHLNVAATFDMRGDLVRVVARMLNGMAEQTPLMGKALAHLGREEAEYCEAVYRRLIPRERLLSTPPLIYRAWLQGDSAAAELVARAADDYALAAEAMIARTGSRSPDATFGGGVIACAPAEFWPLLAERVHRRCPAAVVKRPDLPAEFGAAIMAGYHAGVDPRSLFERLLDGTKPRRSG